MIRLRRMRWPEHAVCVGGKRNTQVLIEDPEEKGLGMDGRLI
jgi:hypothetical protein